jgi:hypothetical protein
MGYERGEKIEKERKVIYDSELDSRCSRRIPVDISYQDLLSLISPNERIVVFFDLRGQRGYVVISSRDDYNWYQKVVRHDKRTQEKFFWIINQELVE